MTKPYYVHKVYTGLINKNLPVNSRITWLRFLDNATLNDSDTLVVLNEVINILLNHKIKHKKDHITYHYPTINQCTEVLLYKHFLLDHKPK